MDRILNTNSPIPLYRQLADIIRNKIEENEYKIGVRIPSEHDLAKNYKIGRPTVREATEFLVRKGLLFRKRGSGTFVKDNKNEIDIFSLAGTSAAFQKNELSVRTKIIKKMQLINYSKQSLWNNGKTYCLVRLNIVRNKPVLLEEIFLNAGLFPKIDQYDFSRESVSDIVKNKYHLDITQGRQSFRICRVNRQKAQILQINKNNPVLQVKRILNFSQADKAIYAKLYCLTDSYAFSQSIHVNQLK